MKCACPLTLSYRASQQAMLEVNPFLVRKMLLQKDTLQLARQHLREQYINQARFYDREAFGAPSNQTTRYGCKTPRRRPDSHASSADLGQNPLQ